MRGLLLPLVLALAGCAINRSPVPKVISTASTYTLADYNQDVASYAASTGASAIAIRNRIVYNLITEVDYLFWNYETTVYSTYNKLNTAGDFVKLGLTAASTLTVAARGKTILSALLSGTTGMDLSINKNLFQQQTIQAICANMEASRDSVRTGIVQRMALDSSVYPLAAARSDLIRYFFAGTLSAGLEQIQQSSANNAQTQRTRLDAATPH
jgi:hypothetical protein